MCERDKPQYHGFSPMGLLIGSCALLLTAPVTHYLDLNRKGALPVFLFWIIVLIMLSALLRRNRN